MRIQVTARHCEVPDPIQDRARELIQKLTRYESRISSADVVFDVEGHRNRVEAVLSIDRAEPAVASAEADDFRGALALLSERLAKILRRRHSQRANHQAPGLSEAPERKGGVAAE